MIEAAVNSWERNKHKLREKLVKKHPDSYVDLVTAVIAAITEEDDMYQSFSPDPERIHVIDDGDYQGTQIYVIAEKGYQPSRYWLTGVSYGSCSGCDTLEAIRVYADDPPNEKQIDAYMDLCLHLVQQLTLAYPGWRES